VVASMTGRSRRALLCWLLVTSAVFHVWSITHTVAPAQDTIRFLHYSRRLCHEPWLTVFRSEHQHPFYPLVCSFFYPLAEHYASTWGLDAYFWMLQAVASVFGVLTVPLVYLLAREVLGEIQGLWAAAAFAWFPQVLHVTADGLSDGPHFFWTTLALWLYVGGLNRGSYARLAAAGLAAGMAFWTRPEGLLVAVAAALVLGWSCAFRQGPWLGRRPLTAAALGGMALVVPVLAFFLATGRLTTKATARGLLGLEESPGALPTARLTPLVPGPQKSDVRRKAERDAVLQLSLPVPDPEGRTERLEGDGLSPGTRPRTLTAAVYQYVNELCSAGHYVGIALALLGYCWPRAQPGRAPGSRVLLVLFVLFTGLLLALYLRVGYISGRHVFVPLLCLMPRVGEGLRLVTVGLTKAVNPLLPHERLRAMAPGAATGIVAGLLAVTTWPQALEPLHPSRWGLRAAGEWLRHYANQEAIVLDIHLVATAYAGLPAYGCSEHRRALSDPRLAFVVIDWDDLARRDPPYHQIVDFLRRYGQVVAAFPAREGSLEPGVFIFEIRRSVQIASEPTSQQTPPSQGPR
jgi:hypothetical protein